MEKNIYLEKLLKEFERKKELNPSYSFRAFSRDTNIGQSELSRIISNKRKLSPQLAYKMGQYLKLSQEEMCQLVLSTLN